MSLWYIINTVPKKAGNRKRRCWRSVVMAETAEAALEIYKKSAFEIGEIEISEWGGNQVDLRGILV